MAALKRYDLIGMGECAYAAKRLDFTQSIFHLSFGVDGNVLRSVFDDGMRFDMSYIPMALFLGVSLLLSGAPD